MTKKDPTFTFIKIDDREVSNQILRWSILRGTEGELNFCYYLKSKGRKREQVPLSRCQIIPTVHHSAPLLLETKGNPVRHLISKASSYGGTYTVVWYDEGSKPYVMKNDNIVIRPVIKYDQASAYEYFFTTAKARIEQRENAEKKVLQNVLSQMEKLIPSEETALHAYCSKATKPLTAPENFIYPFGVNQSQIKAVESAFSSQISIIEGPPGTGKTQTILNIIANILIQNKTVAIVSNNNSAVENVYEKLEKEGLDYIIAKLGSAEKRELFFENQKDLPAKQKYDDQNVKPLLEKVKLYLKSQDEVATLQTLISELEIEYSYLQKWRGENISPTSEQAKKPNFPPQKITKLMAFLNYLDKKPQITISDRVRVFFSFGILRTSFLNNAEKRFELFQTLQLSYYEKTIQSKRTLLETHKSILEKNDFKNLIKQLGVASMKNLKAHLSNKSFPLEKFDSNNYRKDFNSFLNRYPLIGSSTHSIQNSLAQGAILDYVIIDEASQQDIIPGILGLACAKNAIIVGDRKQLPHIPMAIEVTPPSPDYDCSKLSLLDSFYQMYKEKAPITLLREHYRCHPKIIQFCNSQFYDNQLIPMTIDNGENSLSLIITAKGNHTRQLSNLRELDSLEALSWDPHLKKGFIAPFNNQVNLAKSHLSSDFIRSTIHKFQGRECDEIIFSTVLDKKYESQKKVQFVDNPFLLNVAVSRAKNKFTLVTGEDVFDKNSNIGALIRHIAYYAKSDEIHHSPVVSVFDLLYKDYDVSLRELNSQLRTKDSKYKSEQIVEDLLSRGLRTSKHKALAYHTQVFLNQIANPALPSLTAEEKTFMKNFASCDFVIYFKTGKTPAGVIEVDGGYHEQQIQKHRDALKDSILQKSSVPILRIKTIESRVEEKIATFLESVLKDPFF